MSGATSFYKTKERKEREGKRNKRKERKTKGKKREENERKRNEKKYAHCFRLFIALPSTAIFSILCRNRTKVYNLINSIFRLNFAAKKLPRTTADRIWMECSKHVLLIIIIIISVIIVIIIIHNINIDICKNI